MKTLYRRNVLELGVQTYVLRGSPRPAILLISSLICGMAIEDRSVIERRISQPFLASRLLFIGLSFNGKPQATVLLRRRRLAVKRSKQRPATPGGIGPSEAIPRGEVNAGDSVAQRAVISMAIQTFLRGQRDRDNASKPID